jgi:peptidoglycan/LPS O-acetylase OafA/YrhL
MLVERHNIAIGRDNNFDLIRLLAASQVVLVHLHDHLHLQLPQAVDFFPGVWVFFIVSGFLVTASLARCESLHEYFRNRVLRIYPALWAMTAVTVVLLLLFGQLNSATPVPRFLAYVVGQATIVQLVDGGLGMFRSFGTGGVNGVLWTIATEIQYYVVLPLMLWFAGTAVTRRRTVLIILFCCSLLVYQLVLPLWLRAQAAGGLPGVTRDLVIVLYTSIATHLFGFLFGVFFYLGLPNLIRFVRDKFVFWLLGYLAFIGLTYGVFGLVGWDLERTPVAMLCERVLLAGVVFSFAFSFRGLAQVLLRRNDVSYGVYIYHMLVINILVQFGLVGLWRYGVLCALAAAAVSFASWRLVEKPALSAKRRNT